MGNSPRYVGFLDPPYSVTLTDDSGALLDLTGCVSGSFTLTMLRVDQGGKPTGFAQQGVGVWTVANQTTNKGQASYQWTANDMASAGIWLVYTTVKLPAEPNPREFDPELISILTGTVGAGAAPPGVLPAPIAQAIFFNVHDYGARGDGTTDDTAAIAAARSATNSAGGGAVYYPPGTYITGNQTLYPFVHDLGAGKQATTIKLKNGANTDLFSAQTSMINLSASAGSGSTGNLYDFSISNMTLDGNQANQSGGPSYPLRFYGHSFILQNLEIRNGYSGGALIDWNAGNNYGNADGMESQWINVKVHNCNGIGLQMGGPHDSQITQLVSFNHQYHCIHLAPNAGGIQINNSHFWGPGTGVHAVPFLAECGVGRFTNCIAEGGDLANVVLLGRQYSWIGGHIFGAGTGNTTVSGIQLGQQAGNTPYQGMINQSAGLTTGVSDTECLVDTLISNCLGSNGGVWFANDEGKNSIRAVISLTSGAYFGGVMSTNDTVEITGYGLTPDGTLQKSSMNQVAGQAGSTFHVIDGTSDVFDVDCSSKRVIANNGAELRINSGDYSGTVVRLNTDNTGNAIFGGRVQVQSASTMYSGSGAPSNSNGANGDFYFRTDTPGTNLQRIYVKSAGSWVGIL